MSFQTPLLIKSVISAIDKKEYLLPAIQREFIWTPDQIVGLFDSLMQDYPIGSFLFWKVEKETANNFQFYEMIRDFHERDNQHNPKANLSGNEAPIAILDGQQRLTALYIGLKGSYAGKVPWKWWKSDDAFPKKKLYLNLLAKSQNPEYFYDFRLLTDDEAKKNTTDIFWFKVGDILKFKDLSEILDFQINSELSNFNKVERTFANRALANLFSVIHTKQIINYFLETDQDIEKVLNIFIRVNKMGTPLSYSDLLLSIATAQWKTRDAREVITSFVDDLNSIGNGFKFNKDFVLKSCLVLSGYDVRFKVSNFNKQNMKGIEEKWDDLAFSIKQSVKLIASFGYNSETLPSNNAVIPIAYYIMQNKLQEGFVKSSNTLEDRKRIQQWLIASLLKRSFSGTPDFVLSQIRRVLFENKGDFPLEKLIEEFRGETKSIIFSMDDLNNLLTYRYGESYTFSTLAIVYPTLDFSNLFHIDHIFPKSLFNHKQLKKLNVEETKIASFIEKVDSLSNLQLMEGLRNEEKSNTMPEEWIKKVYPTKSDRENYLQKNYIPDIDLRIENFEKFFDEREKLLKNEFKKKIGVLVA
jgi:uncharacterized protein with ParB-like and HNH nuclease domain